ncbi:MAG: murein biosynthesis integral membrane protein MurJ, partial [Roseiflexus sp.]|nr:murein biosynthesis integral membrane protein MurJ [Roseiflexus sp.]
RIGETLWKCLIASLALFGIAWLLSIALAFAGPLVALMVAGGVASLTYAGICLALRVEALDFLIAALWQRVAQRHGANSHIESTE